MLITVGAVSFALQTKPFSLRAWSLKFSHTEALNKCTKNSCCSMRHFNSNSCQINNCRKLPTHNTFWHQYSNQFGITLSAYAAELQHGEFCWVLYSPLLSHPHQVVPHLVSLHAPPSLLTTAYGFSPCKVLQYYCKQESKASSTFAVKNKNTPKQTTKPPKDTFWLQKGASLCQPTGGTCQEPDPLLHVLVQEFHWFSCPSNFSMVENS